MRRIFSFFRNLNDLNFIRYAAGRLAHAALKLLWKCGDLLIQFIHATPARSAAPEDLKATCVRHGATLFVTADFHSEECLAFVRGLSADLGIVYGTRILKPELFSLPRLGSINIHKRKVPDYRGGGPVGLWELLDGQPEIGITVHQVTERLDAGSVVNSATIPIDDFDTLNSLALKAHVVGNDLLVRSVRDFARGTVCLRPQESGGRAFRSPSPHQLARHERQLRSRRRHFRPKRSRPAAKLLIRTLGAAPILLVRNWMRRFRGAFPVTILFHHLVTDRPHALGIATELFYKHVQYLRRYYRIASLEEAVEMLKSNRLNEPAVVLTFDDGYGDNYLTLRAITEQLDVPVTLFISTDHVTRQTEFEHDVANGRRGFCPLTWEQIKHLERDGFGIGSHTRTHYDCGTSELAILHSEIAGSRTDLEERLGRPVEFFSFPFGTKPNISAVAAELAARTYPYTLSAYGGTNAASGDGRIRHLKRAPHPNDLWELELQLQSFLELRETVYSETIPSRKAA